MAELADAQDFARVTSVEGVSLTKYKKLIRTCGGIGRHAGFRFQSVRVQVQVLSGAPISRLRPQKTSRR